MRFKDLIQYIDPETRNINLEPVRKILTNTPEEVLEDLYHDHGANEVLQSEYAEIDIERITWSSQSYPIENLININILEDNQDWVNTCKHKSSRVSDNYDWGQIEHSRLVNEHWMRYGTWRRRPIVFEINNELCLVEGHSRIGCLQGLYGKDLINLSPLHDVWLGQINANIGVTK